MSTSHEASPQVDFEAAVDRHPKITDLDIGALKYSEYDDMIDHAEVQRAVRWAHKRRKEDKEAKDFYKWAKKAKIVISGTSVSERPAPDGPDDWLELQRNHSSNLHIEQRTTKQKPVANKPKPVANKPKPVANKPKPVANKPKPSRLTTPISATDGIHRDNTPPPPVGSQVDEVVDAAKLKQVHEIEAAYRSLEGAVAKQLKSDELELMLDVLRVGNLDSTLVRATPAVLHALHRRLQAALKKQAHHDVSSDVSATDRDLKAMIDKHRIELNTLQQEVLKLSSSDKDGLRGAMLVGGGITVTFALLIFFGQFRKYFRPANSRVTSRRSPLS